MDPNRSLLRAQRQTTLKRSPRKPTGGGRTVDLVRASSQITNGSKVRPMQLRAETQSRRGRCRYGRRRPLRAGCAGGRTAERGQSVSLALVSLYPTGAASVFLLSQPSLPPTHLLHQSRLQSPLFVRAHRRRCAAVAHTSSRKQNQLSHCRLAELRNVRAGAVTPGKQQTARAICIYGKNSVRQPAWRTSDRRV
uniref:Uncharacterized protein n=1 Tax=Plectus sambesii TaxID=2011161 RepID=A0A914V6S8_9BILA